MPPARDASPAEIPEPPEAAAGEHDDYADDEYAEHDDYGDDPNGYDGIPPRRTRGRRRRGWIFWSIIGVGLAAIIVVLGFFGWFLRQANPSGDPGKEVTVEIPADVTDDQLASLLAENDVVASAGAFSLYMRVRSPGAVPAGKYTFRTNESFSDALATLRGGPTIIEYKLTIPEGFTVSQIAARVGKDVPTISEQQFLEAVASGQVRSQYQPQGESSMEGFLFPDTYMVNEKETAVELLTRMVSQFDKIGTAVGIGNVDGMSAYDVVIVASMIEKEAKIPDERAKVARVIYNRLNENMTLGIDATLLYTKPDGRTLTQSDLNADTPYNTRKRKGLPPTPICNPGKASLQAAAQPADGDWLYYVISDADGRHAFSSSYDQFLKDKKKAQDAGLL